MNSADRIHTALKPGQPDRVPGLVSEEWYHDNDTVSFRYDEMHRASQDRATVEGYRKELGVTESGFQPASSSVKPALFFLFIAITCPAEPTCQRHASQSPENSFEL